MNDLDAGYIDIAWGTVRKHRAHGNALAEILATVKHMCQFLKLMLIWFQKYPHNGLFLALHHAVSGGRQARLTAERALATESW